jgi:hypothetical protein
MAVALIVALATGRRWALLFGLLVGVLHGGFRNRSASFLVLIGRVIDVGER